MTRMLGYFEIRKCMTVTYHISRLRKEKKIYHLTNTEMFGKIQHPFII